MSTPLGARNRPAPFLWRFVEDAAEAVMLPGGYDERRDIWFVDDGAGGRALVTSAPALTNTVTQTKVRHDRTDED